MSATKVPKHHTSDYYRHEYDDVDDAVAYQHQRASNGGGGGGAAAFSGGRPISTEDAYSSDDDHHHHHAPHHHHHHHEQGNAAYTSHTDHFRNKREAHTTELSFQIAGSRAKLDSEEARAIVTRRTAANLAYHLVPSDVASTAFTPLYYRDVDAHALDDPDSRGQLNLESVKPFLVEVGVRAVGVPQRFGVKATKLDWLNATTAENGERYLAVLDGDPNNNGGAVVLDTVKVFDGRDAMQSNVIAQFGLVDEDRITKEDLKISEDGGVYSISVRRRSVIFDAMASRAQQIGYDIESAWRTQLADAQRHREPVPTFVGPLPAEATAAVWKMVRVVSRSIKRINALTDLEFRVEPINPDAKTIASSVGTALDAVGGAVGDPRVERAAQQIAAITVTLTFKYFLDPPPARCDAARTTVTTRRDLDDAEKHVYLSKMAAATFGRSDTR